MHQPLSPEKANEWRLHALLLKRDEGAIRDICREYGPALFGIISRIIPAPETAEEVLQDVFVKIWERAAQYDPERGRLFTWMAQIARNQALDVVRSATYRRQDKTDGLENSVHTEKELGEEMYINHIGLRKVTDQLEEKYRILIDYLYFRDYSQAEVADELGLPLGTIKSRARKAISELRRILGQERLLSWLPAAMYIALDFIRKWMNG